MHIKLLCVYLIYLLIVDITGICFDTELGASQLASSATWRDCSLHFAINCLFCRMEVACNKTVFFAAEAGFVDQFALPAAVTLWHFVILYQ